MLNTVMLIGNVGADPEMHSLPSGDPVANISLATSRTWKDKQTGQKKKEVEWHRIVFFNKLAEVVNQYVKKGGKLYIEGRIRTRKWQDQGGNDKYTTEIVASQMQMLDGKPEASVASSKPQHDQQQSVHPDLPDGNVVTDGFNDDIPF